MSGSTEYEGPSYRLHTRHQGIQISRSEGKVARLTGLEPATSGVTGRHSNQLSYNRLMHPRAEARDGFF